MKQRVPAVKRGLLYTSRKVDFREAAVALKAHSVHPALRAMDEERLRWAQSRGMKVYPWVVMDRVTLDRCRQSSWIDGVFVNDPELLEKF
jgi:glycerophosphoryl diester phosphodiesterase